MVAHSASPGSYAPIEPPRVAVSGDGTLAAVLESARVTLLEVPSAVAFAEIGIDPDSLGSDVAWVGAPARLLVLSRYAAHSTVHLLDPRGPRAIAEIRLESPMHLVAAVAGSGLLVGSRGCAVLVAGDSHMTAYPFPARAVPVTAGAAAAQFVVALAGSIEEWDPQSRQPRRRLRLPRAAAITAVGGSERVVWMTTQQEPARIDVIPLVNRGQPKAHDLPEPIARICGHPRSDLVACIGADSGRLYVVDLDGRARLRAIGLDGLDRVEATGLVLGRVAGVLAAQAGRPIAIVALDGRELEVEPGAGPRPPAPIDPPESRDEADHGDGPARRSWRDDVVAWSRVAISGAAPPPPAAPSIDAMLARFDLAPPLRPVLLLLYGAHLCGELGAAPIDVARLLDGQWDEALGRGELARRGVADYARSRVMLSPILLRVLDELPPATGALIGEPGASALLGPCVVVAGDEPLAAVAERCRPHVGGAILVARGDAPRAAVFLEARARGAVPMLPAPAALDAVPGSPAILVVTDPELADRLGLPRLA